MAGRLSTRRWNDPAIAGEGTRILVCRFRPRGVRREDEPWDEWWKDLGPSVELHAAAYGKHAAPIDFAEYRRRYVAEMADGLSQYHLRALKARVAAGEDLVLLCSSACTDDKRCHRSVLCELALGLP